MVWFVFGVVGCWGILVDWIVCGLLEGCGECVDVMCVGGVGC